MKIDSMIWIDGDMPENQVRHNKIIQRLIELEKRVKGLEMRMYPLGGQ